MSVDRPEQDRTSGPMWQVDCLLRCWSRRRHHLTLLTYCPPGSSRLFDCWDCLCSQSRSSATNVNGRELFTSDDGELDVVSMGSPIYHRHTCLHQRLFSFLQRLHADPKLFQAVGRPRPRCAPGHKHWCRMAARQLSHNHPEPKRLPSRDACGRQ